MDKIKSYLYYFFLTCILSSPVSCAKNINKNIQLSPNSNVGDVKSSFAGAASDINLASNTITSSIKPLSRVRAVHFVMGSINPHSRAISYENAKKVIDLAYIYNFNTVVIQIANSVDFGVATSQLRRSAWSKSEFLKLVSYVRSLGMQFIPEIKLLTHQEKYFHSSRPELMFNKSTYDPAKSEVYDSVFKYLTAVIKSTNPAAIHIGHDEVAGFNRPSHRKWLDSGEQILPAHLYLYDVLRVHQFIKSKGLKTWMWGDMLISPDEFPSMRKGGLHARGNGYGRVLRSKIPKDIVICDWHYADNQIMFPTLRTMQNEGFRVIAATWKKRSTIENFIQYAKNNNAYGVMATTWFHVLRGEWELVEKIFSDTSRNF